MVETREDALSTFSIDVDTGSYTIARRKLREGTVPPPASVRVEEFVNYFHYDYAGPDDDRPFAVHMEAAPSPYDPKGKRHLLRIGLQGERLAAEERKPVHLTFLIDVSGSMQSADKLGMAKKSLEVLTNNLRPGDTVAIATYAGRVAKILDPTGIDQRGTILSALRSLEAGGSTAMNDGMKLAYSMAASSRVPGHVNRVIVISDGDANIGRSSHQGILSEIEGYVDEGITLSTIGVGMGNYKDTMMEQLANKGDGNYYYIDSIDEARRVFGEQLSGTLQVIARDVKIQVAFDPKAVVRYRLIGYENRDIADRDFRNDDVDAGEIGAGHTVTALYEIELADDAPEQLAEVRLRHKKPEGGAAVETTYPLSRAAIHARLADASKSFVFAAAVAAFAEVLRHSPYAEHIELALVEEVARSATEDQEARREFVSLVQRARELGAGRSKDDEDSGEVAVK
jgi:Ca-activated chloride channel family protein